MGYGLSPTRLSPTSDVVCESWWPLCFWWTGYKLEVPSIPSSGMFNFLELLMECRRTVYLLDYWFFVKDSDSTAREKRCTGRGVGEGVRGFPAPWSTPLSPGLCVFTSLEALWGSVLWGFREASLHGHDGLNIGHSWLIQTLSNPSSLPGG